MDFGAFSIISLFFVFLGVRVVFQLIQRWRATWDHSFTPSDRQLVDQAAFFVLVPISVALHEFGHAIAVWSFGKEVVDFGFYGFAGYVAYFPFGLDAVQRTIISAAGVIVNLVLCVACLALVFLRKPPMRASYNELLIQFAIISGLNAFILYPILDIASGLNGDWRQMYGSGVPWLTAIIVTGQAAIIFAGYQLFANPTLKARIASLTDIPPGYERGVLGGIRPGKIESGKLDPAERAMHEAAERVISGWATSVTTGLQRFPAGTAITLQWHDGPREHAVAVRAFKSGITDVMVIPTTGGDNRTATPRVLQRWQTLPQPDELTMVLRIAMENSQQQ